MNDIGTTTISLPFKQRSQSSLIGRGLSTSMSEKKIYTDPNFFIAKTAMENIIKKIETTERKEKKKMEKLTNTLKKQQDAERSRLSAQLQERKERLKTEVRLRANVKTSLV